MPLFRVILSRSVGEYASVDVEAPNQDSAEAQAVDLAESKQVGPWERIQDTESTPKVLDVDEVDQC